MVNWKVGLLLLALLAGLGVLAYQTRPHPPAAVREASLIPCDGTLAVAVSVTRGADRLSIERATARDTWRVTAPQAGPADPQLAQQLTSAIGSLRVLNTVTGSLDPGASGLGAPSRLVSCRSQAGASYTLSVGNQSFDGSGYYAQVGGDARIYVISSVEVDEFDRAVSRPMVRASPSP